jgi:hypothetical protein
MVIISASVLLLTGMPEKISPFVKEVYWKMAFLLSLFYKRPLTHWELQVLKNRLPRE